MEARLSTVALVGAVSSPILTADSRRVALSFSSTGGNCLLWPAPIDTGVEGFAMPGGFWVFEMAWDRYGPIIQGDWFGYSIIGQTISIAEVLSAVSVEATEETFGPGSKNGVPGAFIPRGKPKPSAPSLPKSTEAWNQRQLTLEEIKADLWKRLRMSRP